MKYLKSFNTYIVNESDAMNLDKIEDMNADELAKVQDDSESEDEPGLKQPIVVPAEEETK